MTNVLLIKSENRSKWLAVSIAAGALAACGGGGGGGVDPLPPPPVTPPPSPPPPTSQGMSAPERATTGAGPAAVVATVEGRNFTTGPAPGTAFRMLQSAVTQNGTAYVPDTVTNAAGGAATFDGGQLSVSIRDSRQNPWSGYADLEWTRVGYWTVWTDWYTITNGYGAFVIGYETPATAVPTTGTATFNGRAQGAVFNVSMDRPSLELTGGTASFEANFGTRLISGTVIGLMVPDSVNGIATGNVRPWNDFAFSSTIAGNSFGGNTRVTTTPGGITSLAGNATGTVEGKFFGPGAQEAGAVWTLFDGAKAAIGTLSGKRP